MTAMLLLDFDFYSLTTVIYFYYKMHLNTPWGLAWWHIFVAIWSNIDFKHAPEYTINTILHLLDSVSILHLIVEI